MSSCFGENVVNRIFYNSFFWMKSMQSYSICSMAHVLVCHTE